MTDNDQSITSGDVFKSLEEIYAENKKTVRRLTAEDRIVQDLGFDSLGAVELLVALEKRFGVTLLGDPRVAGVRTVGDLVAVLAEPRQD